ncbi:phosphatase 2C-like domain-containing protein [Panaeolus papilionaceus]|nr:phosphatase 2C-like domain-containing protein [Panaeolus papilionaceus]
MSMMSGIHCGTRWIGGRTANSGLKLGLRSRPYTTASNSRLAAARYLQRPWVLLGGGVLTGSVIYSGSMLYLDSADVGNRKPQAAQPCQPSDDFLVNTSEYLKGTGKVNLESLKIARIYVASHKSNNPSEDATHVGEFELSPTLRYASFSVYDGHVGGETANYLAKNLSMAVAGAVADRVQQQLIVENRGDLLNSLNTQGRAPGTPPDSTPSPEEAFVNVDNHLVHEAAQLVLGLSDEAYAALQRGESTDASRSTDHPFRRQLSRTEAIKTLQFAQSGSCALMALNCDGRPLGNSHSVNEQGPQNPSEAARVAALHPNEPDLLKNGRYLGWALTRAFGDASMKWPTPVQKRIQEEFLGEAPRTICKTPPYFTAEPEITTFQVQKGDFMVIATDGLWDCLTNEEVVGLTGLWVDSQNQKVSKPGSGFERIFPVEGDRKSAPLEPKQLPVKFSDDYEDKTAMYSSSWFTEKRFINVDDKNVGKYLIRNALGGADDDLRGALLAMKPPRNRDFR